MQLNSAPPRLAECSDSDNINVVYGGSWLHCLVAFCAQVLVMPFLKKRINAAFERIDKQVHTLRNPQLGPLQPHSSM